MQSTDIAIVAEKITEARTLFAIWLRRCREARGLSLEALAVKLGPECAPESVLAWEAGGVRPSRRLAGRLAHLFDVPRNEHPAFVLFAISDLDAPDDYLNEDIRAGSDFDPDAPWRVHPQPPSNLPVQLTTFVGREVDVERVAEFLSRLEVRLLTLLGPPGIGKTRLSIEAARHLLATGDYEDGVFFVPLAAVTHAAGIFQAIASALGVKEATGRPASEVLADFLRDKRLLLVLDNMEQIDEAGPPLTDLLTSAPQIQIVTTSRMALHVSGEHAWRVPPLPVPPSSTQPTAESLSRSEATDLFVQRARAIQPDLIVDDATAPVIADICRKLDGLPLAIELAAARVNVLKPQGILDRLDSRLGVLTGGAQDLPPRQRTLRGAIDWSYNLLNEAEKAAYRRLSVFVGGFTLEAAERVCDEAQQLSPLALDVISSLVDKSLLKQEDGPDGQTRFTMLETIREYGLERLHESGEENEVRRNRALAMLALAEEAEPYMTTGGRDPWLRKIDVDLDNIRAALTWSLSYEGDAEVGLRLAGVLGWYWYFRGDFTEGRRWLDEIIKKADALRHTKPGMQATQAAAWLANNQGDLTVARARAEESIISWRAFGSDRDLGFTLTILGITLVAQGEHHAGYSFLEEAISKLRSAHDPWYLALGLDALGDAATWLNKLQYAKEFYSESLTLFSELRDSWGLAYEYHALGQLALSLNEPDVAIEHFQRALPMQIALNNKSERALLLFALGDALLRKNEQSQAKRQIEQALELFHYLGMKRGVLGCLRYLGYISLRSKGSSTSIHMFSKYLSHISVSDREYTLLLCISSTASCLSSLGNTLSATTLFSFVATRKPRFPFVDQTEHDRWLALARAKLDRKTWSENWAQGQTMDFAQALLLAKDTLAERDSRISSTRSGLVASRAPESLAGLSKREIELLRLVATGITNQELAKQLCLSPNTVRAHLYSIYSKIGVTSRTAAAHFANKHNLL